MIAHEKSKLLCFAVVIAFAILAVGPKPASASVCTLADHIRSANTNTAVGFCPAGTSHDIITIAEDITLTEPLPTITGTITIEGGGHTISGDKQFRIFDVNGGNLTLKNLTMRDGKAENGGAVRLRAGALTVYESSFVGNRTEKSAGAIYANGGTLDIRNSRFEDNCAQQGYYGQGRSLNQDARSLDADGCVKIDYAPSATEGNFSRWEWRTNVDGGAIRLLNGAQATIESSVFTNNKATHGGAISTSSRADRLVVNSSGGARLVIKGSSFLGNHASQSGGAIGALWSGGGSTSISNSSFIKNSAKDGGGAIVAYDATNTLDIANSTFSENRSDRVGGALLVSLAEVTVTHATFIENRAFDGDAIYNFGSRLFLRNSIIVGAGRADDCVGGFDQSIGNLSPDRTCGFPLGSDVMLGELTGSPAYYAPLDLSPAVDAAAAEYCLGTDQLGTERPQGGGCDIGAIESTTARPAPIEAQPFCPLPDQIIAANTDRPYKACPAGNGADTIYLIRDITLSEKLQPITSDITIEGNGYTISGDHKFRIFDVYGGMLTIKNLTMTKGSASTGLRSGGAIRLQNNGRAIVSDSRFVNNSANYGGAVYLWSDNSWMTVNNSSFVENRAANGGAIYLGSGRISVRDSSFVNNSAEYSHSGAIRALRRIRVDVDNSTFIGNSPYAVSMENGSTATLTHVTIQSNYNRPVNLQASSSWSSFHSDGWLNLRNSIIAGRGFAPEDCDNLKQNIGNLIEDGSCSPRLSGDPMLAEATDESAYLDLQAGSPAIGAADPRFCTDSDQIGRARAIVGRCDLGAIESTHGSPAQVEPAASETDAACVVTTTHALNFRDGPSLAGARIGLLRQGATLDAVRRTAGWFNVEYRGVSGWISAHYVVTQGDCR